MDLLQHYLKKTTFIIKNVTKGSPEKLTTLFKKYEKDAKVIIFAKKTIKNYKFFENLDESTTNNNKFFIGHYGNYATWLKDEDLSQGLLMQFLNQSVATVKVDKVVDMKDYSTGIIKDGKQLSLSPSIMIL